MKHAQTASNLFPNQKLGVLGQLKNLARRIPGLRVAYNRTIAELRLLCHVTKNGLWSRIRRRKTGSASRSWQAPLVWSALISPRGGSPLTGELAAAGIRHEEGGHAVYVPPQSDLARKLGAFVTRYPGDAGFKILKDFQPPHEARYVGDVRRHTWTQSVLVGKARDLVPVANLLYQSGLGPRLYDVAQLNAGELSLTMFVVQHIEGEEPSELECQQFLRRVETLVSDGMVLIALPEWRNESDFRCPSCSGNLLKAADNQRLHYIDFQNFLLRNPEEHLARILKEARKGVHFGNEYFLRGGRYLYQEVPGTGAQGRRDTALRWRTIRTLLERAGIQIGGRLVLDIGCNTGMMLAEALNEGALWGLGWDRPGVVEHAERILGALGYTRFDLTGAELKKGYDLFPAVPSHLRSAVSDSIVFYLAIRHHIGFLDSLASTPWGVMVYEGAEGETGVSFQKVFEELHKLVPCELVASSEIRDGDCDARPLAILRRRVGS
jgi:hypothetical protein